MGVPELLAPAGGMEALVAAVAAGADAVYVGLGMYNARAASRGLSLEELERACALAHKHGVRVYVTLNALLCEDEFAGAIDLAGRAAAAGADAFIIADTGLARALCRAVPGVEVHLSTQAGVASAEGVALAAHELGVARVTCARELSVGELEALCATGVSVEAFCHGAICVCYSGACAFSALRRARSANRGACTQPCRASYALTDGSGRVLAGGSAGTACGGDRLLCPRDLLGIRHVGALAAAGVAALKVEGRMKNPDYVYNVVRCYRAALDAVAAGRALEEDELDALEGQLARSFNRGFTSAYLEDARAAGRGPGLMSYERSINQGAYVGRLAGQLKDEALVELAAAVHAGDTLEIRSTPGAHTVPGVPKRWPMVPVLADAAAGELLRVHCKRRVEPGSAVHVVRDARLLAEAALAVERLRDEYGAREEGALAAGASDMPGAAVAPVRAARADEHAAAAAVPLGEGPRERWGGRTVEDGQAVRAGAGSASARAMLDTLWLAAGPAEAQGLLAAGRRVGVYAWRLDEAEAAWDGLLSKLVVVLDEVFRPGDAARVRALCRVARAVVCRNLGQIPVVRAAGVPWEAAAPVNVWNAEAARWLAHLGCHRVLLSDELSPADARAMIAAAGDAVAFGRMVGAPVQLMVTEHCLLSAEGPCDGTCATCSRRAAAAAGERALVEADGTRLRVEVDARGRTRVFYPVGAGRR